MLNNMLNNISFLSMANKYNKYSYSEGYSQQEYSGEEKTIIDFINKFQDHVKQCQYFNGFSIARDVHNRDSSVFVTCPCGEHWEISGYLWYLSHRYRNLDLEDLIAEFNYQAKNYIYWNMEQRVNAVVQSEVAKRLLSKEVKIHRQTKEIRKNINPTFRLEI